MTRIETLDLIFQALQGARKGSVRHAIKDVSMDRHNGSGEILLTTLDNNGNVQEWTFSSQALCGQPTRPNGEGDKDDV
jgi:hypothetical protein